MTGVREHLLVILLFLVLTFAFTAPFALHAGGAVVSSHVDNLLNVWILSWDGHALINHPTGLFQANINYPSPDSLAFSEHLLAVALVAAPLAWATGNAVFAYNLVLLVGFALCGYTMYLLVKYITRRKLAALAAGIFFAFVPYHFSVIVHVHVSLYLLQPLILLFLFRYCDEGRPRHLVGLGIAFLAQALLGWYQLAFCSIPIALFLVWKVAAPGRRERARRLLAEVGVLALCMLLVIPLAIPYFRLHADIPEGEGEPAINVIQHASLHDFFRVLPQNYLYGKLGFLPTGSPGGGNALFPGFLIFPLSVAALVFVISGFRSNRRKRKEAVSRLEPDESGGGNAIRLEPDEAGGAFARVPGAAEEPCVSSGAEPEGTADAALDPGAGDAPPRTPGGKEADPPRGYFVFFAVLGLVCFVLSLGPNPHGCDSYIYQALHKLPIYGFVRFPIRYHIMVILSLAVVAGYACAYLQGYLARRKGRAWGAAAAFAVVVLLLLEFLTVNLPYAEVAVGSAVPRVYRDLEKVEEAVIVEAPMPFVGNSVIYEDPLGIPDYVTLDNTFLSAQREHDAVYFSIYHWKRILNGMSGYYPLFYRRALVEMRSFPSPRSLDFLRGCGVNHVVVHWDYYPGDEEGRVREALEGMPGVVMVEDYPGDGITLYRLAGLETARVDELTIPELFAPALSEPGLSFHASIGLFNRTGLPFVNLSEERQPLRLEWRDAAGKVVQEGESYLYAPFFIAAGEGAVASFQVKAPGQPGTYTLTVSAGGGVLEGLTRTIDMTVGPAVTTHEGGPGGGSLALLPREGEEAPDLSPGLVFAPYVKACNLGPALWERESSSVTGSVGVKATWTSSGDPEYGLSQFGMLPCDLSPGQELTFPVPLQAPTEAGTDILTLQLECLGVGFAGEPVSITVTVSD